MRIMFYFVKIYFFIFFFSFFSSYFPWAFFDLLFSFFFDIHLLNFYIGGRRSWGRKKLDKTPPSPWIRPYLFVEWFWNIGDLSLLKWQLMAPTIDSLINFLDSTNVKFFVGTIFLKTTDNTFHKNFHKLILFIHFLFNNHKH